MQAGYLLGQLLEEHPAMSLVVVQETERFLFKAHSPAKAIYYGVVFLNQIVLTKRRDERTFALSEPTSLSVVSWSVKNKSRAVTRQCCIITEWKLCCMHRVLPPLIPPSETFVWRVFQEWQRGKQEFR